MVKYLCARGQSLDSEKVPGTCHTLSLVRNAARGMCRTFQITTISAPGAKVSCVTNASRNITVISVALGLNAKAFQHGHS